MVIGLLFLASCAGQNVQSVTERARGLLLSGDTEAALAAYREAVREAPGDALALLGLAVAEYQTQRFADSVHHAEAALRAKPDLSAAGVFIGGGYLELGNPEKAVDPLKSAVAAMPADLNATALLAEALLLLERYEEAESYFQKCTDLQPADPRGWFGLGQAYEALAGKMADEIRAASPESAEAYAVAGDSDLARSRFGPAFVAFRRALEINLKLPGAHAGLAEVYRNTAHPDWADYEDRSETKAPRDDSYGNDLYGRYLRNQPLARHAYERLAQLPASLQLHLHRAQKFDTSASYAEAAAEWREALKLAPGNLRAELGLAWALFRRRDYDAVFPLVKAMLQRHPASADAHFLYGAALMNMENPDGAIPFLGRAVATNERFLPAQAALGQALLRTGNSSEAISHLLAALPSDEDGSLHFQLARAYQLAGKASLAEQARVAYQSFRAAREQALAREERTEITAPVREP